MITSKSSFEEILNLPELASSFPYWFHTRFIEKLGGLQVTLGDLEQLSNGVYRTSEILLGLNHLLETAKKYPNFCQKINNESDNFTDSGIGVMSFPVDQSERFAIICPGGGYRLVASLVEGFPLAKILNDHGISAYILNYTTGKPFSVRMADKDLRQAILHCLKQEKNNSYAMFGFSAGGHLAAGLATKKRGLPNTIRKPELIVLSYPLLEIPNKIRTSNPLYQNYKTMFGDKLDKKIVDEYRISNDISEDSPPIYFWHTTEDELVPFEENAVRFEKILKDKGIHYQFKKVFKGPHGLGVAHNTEAQGWVEESLNFWNSLKLRR